MKKIYLNPFLALLLITAFAGGASFFVLNEINATDFAYGVHTAPLGGHGSKTHSKGLGTSNAAEVTQGL